MGRDQTPHMDGKPSVVFQSTRPIRGATCYGETPSAAVNISIHAPHTGRDSPVRSHRSLTLFQSTRPIRGATYLLPPTYLMLVISIHAPHTGRDVIAGDGGTILSGISIHAPHTGRDFYPGRLFFVPCPFQSTRPIRGATINPNHQGDKSTFQSTRPIRGATPVHLMDGHSLLHFNPRAPYGARLARLPCSASP